MIRTLRESTPLAAQLDFSVTPRYQKGGLFAWTVSDYPLKQAIVDGVVKRSLADEIAEIDAMAFAAPPPLRPGRYRGDEPLKNAT